MALVCLATLGLVAVSAAIGAAVWRLAGLRAAPQLSPIVGFAALLVVGLPLVRLPGWGTTALVAIIVLALVSLADRGVRRIAFAGLHDAVPVTLLALLALCLPFLVSGHFGILGMGNNDDFAMHMSGVRWLAHHETPANDSIVGWGYPLGPHALAATLTAAGLTVPEAMTAVMAAGPLLAARAALTLLGRVPRPARWGLALLAGIPYLAAGYYSQASHKEVLVGGLSVAFVLTLPFVVAALRAPRAALVAAVRAPLPLAVLFAGAVQTMSWPGALWPLAALAGWGALTLAGRGRTALRDLRVRLLAGLAAGGVAVAVLLAPDVHDIIGFQQSSFAHEPAHGLGNLNGPLPPVEALGVWLQPDFRFPTEVPLLAGVLMAGAAVLVLLAAVEWLRRGPRVLGAAVLGDWVVWVALAVVKNPYNAAKGLAVMAPLMGLALVFGAMLAWAPLEDRRTAPAPRRRDAAGVPQPVGAATYAVFGGLPSPGGVRRATVLAVLLAAGLSSFLALRDGVVGADAQASDLRRLAHTATQNQTAFLDPSDYGGYDLFALRAFRPRLLYLVKVLPVRPQKQWHQGVPLDLDGLSTQTINRLRWFITSNTTFASAPPPGIRLAERTRSWLLWERVGTVAPRETLPAEHWQPGATLDCSTPAGRALSRRAGTAVVRPAPVIVPAGAWSDGARDAGSAAMMTLHLPPGRWDVSLQYVSRNAVDISGGGLRTTMPADLDRMSNFFSAGTVLSTGAPVTLRAHVHPLGLIGRLLGARGRTRALASPGLNALGRVAATRHGERIGTVPLARACGRYVDSYTLG